MASATRTGDQAGQSGEGPQVVDRVEVDQRDLRRLVVALHKEGDGKELRKDLVKGLRAAATPAAQAAKQSILSMPATGASDREGASLRTAVAGGVKVEIRTTGKVGVFVVAKSTGMPRNFRNAPKRLNAKSWRHPVHGTKKWVTQVGKPGWFDDAVKKAKPGANRAAAEAMDGMAQRIDQQTRG